MQLRLNRINKVKDLFISEICERETMCKTLSKHIAVFDCFDKTLLVLSAASGSVSITQFATVIGTPVRITSPSLSLVFSISNGIAKIPLKIMRKKEAQ